MKMKRQLPLLTFFILGFCFIAFDACHSSKRVNISGVPKLDPAANILVNGLNVTLQYNTSSQSNGFSITFSNVGNITCSDVSIETTGAYGIVPNSETFTPSPINSSMPQYSCTKSGNNIILTEAPPLSQDGFRPWVDNFTIHLAQTIFTVTVDTAFSASQTLTRGIQTQMYLDSSFSGCGLRGTVLQRIFDCSKMITNYGAAVLGNQWSSGASGSTSGTYYTSFINGANPDPYWFVVSCPSGTSGIVPQQNCAWITPVVESAQPALDTVGGGTFPTFTETMLTGYQKRLLWSGKMLNSGTGYTFRQANGFAQTNGAEEYAYSSANPGTIPTAPHPVPRNNSACIAANGDPLAGGGTFGDQNIRDIISSSSGATIAWQMPSYAMQNIISGGTPTISGGTAVCPASGAVPYRQFCDMPSSAYNNEGFSAINIPGFADSGEHQPTCNSGSPTFCPEVIWASSSAGSGYAWFFFALGSNTPNGGAVDFFPPSLALGVRCASPAWY